MDFDFHILTMELQKNAETVFLNNVQYLCLVNFGKKLKIVKNCVNILAMLFYGIIPSFKRKRKSEKYDGQFFFGVFLRQVGKVFVCDC